MFFLLPWAEAAIPPSVAAVMVSQSQDKPSADSSSQSPPSSPQSNPQEGRDQSTAPPGAKNGVSPCTGNSDSGSSAKSGCKTTKPDAKSKRPHPTSRNDTSSANPGKTDSQTKVVRNGSTDDPDVNLAPSVSSEQTSRQRESTKQLLESSDENLKKISGRKLTTSEQGTVAQIQSYMDQAKKATEEQDVQRAYNLAVKANLLSAELAKH